MYDYLYYNILSKITDIKTLLKLRSLNIKTKYYLDTHIMNKYYQKPTRLVMIRHVCFFCDQSFNNNLSFYYLTNYMSLDTKLGWITCSNCQQYIEYSKMRYYQEIAYYIFTKNTKMKGMDLTILPLPIKKIYLNNEIPLLKIPRSDGSISLGYTHSTMIYISNWKVCLYFKEINKNNQKMECYKVYEFKEILKLNPDLIDENLLNKYVPEIKNYLNKFLHSL